MSAPAPTTTVPSAQDGPPSIQSNLPIAQLESAKFKVAQIMESIVALQATIESGGQSVMPAWPDILAKYNVLLSQSYNLSTSLASIHTSASQQNGSGGAANRGTTTTKPFERLALHPTTSMPDAQFDNELIPLLRNQQTTEVLRLESNTVRRLSERLPASVISLQKDRPNAPETHRAVVDACTAIKSEHDARCDRAARAVALLRERYDWKARLAVEVEEPEEFVPAFEAGGPVPSTGATVDNDNDNDEDDDEDDDNESMAVDENEDERDGDEESSADEAEMAEKALGPPSSPFPG